MELNRISKQILLQWGSTELTQITWNTINFSYAYSQFVNVFVTVNYEILPNYDPTAVKEVTLSNFKIYQRLPQYWLAIGI